MRSVAYKGIKRKSEKKSSLHPNRNLKKFYLEAWRDQSG